jgi:predicted RNA methylase
VNASKEGYVLAGGLKIWECTRDLADFLIRERINLKGKQVLDLGCGTGLLGVLAMLLGAQSVHFQDYVSKRWEAHIILYKH